MPTRKKAPFIVIEALDAGGSQTQTDWLVKRLRQAKLKPLQLHFPQEDRATGRLIYDKFLLHKESKHFTRREQALLYIQDFYSRVEDIKAICDQPFTNKLVVSDRFCMSTMAYQTLGLTGAKRQQMFKWLHWLCFEGTPALPEPTLIIFLDTPVEVSLQRLSQKKRDYFETKSKLRAIRNSYIALAREQRWQVITSVNQAGQERTREDIHAEVWELVKPLVA